MRMLANFGYKMIPILMLLCLGLIPADAQTNSSDVQSDPVLLVGAYYHAINTGDYQTAYSYWETPNTQTEAQFAQGFADTTQTDILVRLPVYVDAGAGNFFARIPTWITAMHIDGSTHYYAGCLTLHKTDVPVGNATVPDLNWYIRQGDFQEQQAIDLSILDTSCEGSVSLKDSIYPTQQNNPITLIQSYFHEVASAQTIANAVQAASYWVNPGNGDVLQIDYSDQFSTATDFEVYIDPEPPFASATHAVFPILIDLTMPDTSSFMLTGCLTTDILDVPAGNLTADTPNWYISNGSVNQISNAMDVLHNCAS